MTGIVLFTALWLALGGVGAILLRLGSQRDYGRNIYGRGVYAVVILAGLPGMMGSSAGW